MSKWIKISYITIICVFSLIAISSFFVIIFNDAYFSLSYIIDPKLAAEFGSFFGGFIGTLFSIVSVLLIIYTVYIQGRESRKSNLLTNFFRMIDYHNQNIVQLKVPNLDPAKTDFSEGRRGFVQFKIQINKLLTLVNEVCKENAFEFEKDDILDIVYIIFYYGLEGSWIDFIKEKLKRYPNSDVLTEKIMEKLKHQPLRLGRTNQTNLSTYFRNMYNAIKMVDESSYLSDLEKKEAIKIYRAQLSNPELYVIFFNVLSRFGKKWKENNFIVKYEFLKNIPRNYCDGYEPIHYFKIIYEDDEY